MNFMIRVGECRVVNDNDRATILLTYNKLCG